jgi:serine/threonine protein kinase/Tol biopolymer transport system component
MEPTLSSSMQSQLQSVLGGTYEIEREIGRGGMATVFLARDIKHDRPVALKVLDPDLGAVLGVERFLAEIKVTANLQHPNLLPLFDSGAAGGLLYYVMPFVEGESLRVKLDREKQLPVDEAIRISAAIANALDYAHSHGVVHRDLKPENVLMQSGEPIVADFGIALAVSNAGGTRITQTGLSLGTPTYMSPEQATGDRVIDGRSDQYALGAITYEMLTGEPPHTGATSQAVIARLLTETPRPIRSTRATVPERVDGAVLRSLEKLPADRWPSAGAFRSALLGDVPVTSYHTSATRGDRRRERVAYAIAGVLGVALAALLIMRARERAVPPQKLRFVIPADSIFQEIGESSATPQFAISDDGTVIAFVAHDSGAQTWLWTRRMDDATPHKIPGTTGALSPFWSPDGRSIGFFAAGRLMRYTLGDGSATTIAQVGGLPGGAAWMANGDIVLSRGDGPILKVSSHGGIPVPITSLDSARGELEHVLPQRLADGKHFLFGSYSYRAEFRGGLMFVGSVDGGKSTMVMKGLAFYAAPNHLLVRRDADIKAVSFDPRSLTVGTDETTIIAGESTPLVSVSQNGTIVWLDVQREVESSLELFDRTGVTRRVIGPLGKGAAFEYYAPRLSPDGRYAAAEHHLGQGGGDIYVYDVASGEPRRETFAPKDHSGFVAWSPDGKRMVYNTTRLGGGNIFMKTVGGADEHLFVAATTASWPSDWSRDGKYILFDRPEPATQSDVWIVDAAGGTPKRMLSTPANEMQAVFSPDGKWIAYASDEENGTFNVYVRRFPLTAEQWKISDSGGEAPRWRADGKELFFIMPHERDVSMMSAPIDASSTFHAGKPAELFRKPIDVTGGILRSGVYYDVMPDGKAFVAKIATHTGNAGGGRLNVFVNALAGR